MKKSPKKGEPKKLVVDQMTLLKLLRFNAERSAAGSAHILAMQNRAALLAKLDPEGVLAKAETEARDSASRFNDFDAKVQAILKTIEAQYGISVKDYSINDETGELTRIQAN